MEWHWIEDYENRYRIYKNGDIESCIFKKKKILKPSMNKFGYLEILLRTKGVKNVKHFKLHRLIAIYFIPNPDNKELIDHIDGNKLNNSIENLRWCNRQENNLNRKNTGKYKKGVSYNNGKFQSSLNINGKKIYLGLYKTEDKAHEVFKQKFLEHHGFECCNR